MFEHLQEELFFAREVGVHGAFGQARLLRDLRQRCGRVSLLLEEPIGGTEELGSGLRFSFGPGQARRHAAQPTA